MSFYFEKSAYNIFTLHTLKIIQPQNENDYSDIKVFYYYKVCDSLFELTKSRLSIKNESAKDVKTSAK